MTSPFYDPELPEFKMTPEEQEEYLRQDEHQYIFAYSFMDGENNVFKTETGVASVTLMYETVIDKLLEVLVLFEPELFEIGARHIYTKHCLHQFKMYYVTNDGLKSLNEEVIKKEVFKVMYCNLNYPV
jgi:hypothetical protein